MINPLIEKNMEEAMELANVNQRLRKRKHVKTSDISIKGLEFVKAALLKGSESRYFYTCKEALTTSNGTSASPCTWAGSEADPNTASTEKCLFYPVIGDEIYQRDGILVSVSKIRIRGMLYAPKNDTQGTRCQVCIISLVLYLDKETNGTQSTADLVMANTFSNVGTGQPIIVNTLQNTNGFGRFQVLKRKNIVLQNASLGFVATASQKQQGIIKGFKLSKSFPNGLDVEFFKNAVQGAITSIQDNSFHILILNSNTDLAVKASYVSTVVFKDI